MHKNIFYSDSSLLLLMLSTELKNTSNTKAKSQNEVQFSKVIHVTASPLLFAADVTPS